MNESSLPPELHTLAEAAVEGRLNADERQQLEALVVNDPAARRWYVAYLHQHACLYWARESAETAPAPVPIRLRRRSRLSWAALGFGIAAALGLAIWFGNSPTLVGVATLVSEKSCRWENGSLPMAAGARLPAGQLQLAEGLARVQFDSGAEVTLEGPAELEIVSARRCVLRSGRLVAKVPPPAIGFVVETPTAELIDQGTEFGVHVGANSGSDVQVFDGQVDVRHRSTGRLESVLTGRGVRIGMERVTEYEGEQAPATPAPVSPNEVLTLTTAAGRGKDAYVKKMPTKENHSDVLLLVKRSSHSDWNRKAYLGFDLTLLAGRKIKDAVLTLSFEPSEIGFASEVPDATFKLYGMTDETLDAWSEAGLTWSKAPANQTNGPGLDPKRSVELGSFVIAQGQLRGIRSIGGPALVEFLNADHNRLATLVLVRETSGSGRQCLVHGFASRRHPSLPPPTLKLEVAPR